MTRFLTRKVILYYKQFFYRHQRKLQNIHPVNDTDNLGLDVFDIQYLRELNIHYQLYNEDIMPILWAI